MTKDRYNRWLDEIRLAIRIANMENNKSDLAKDKFKGMTSTERAEAIMEERYQVKKLTNDKEYEDIFYKLASIPE